MREDMLLQALRREHHGRDIVLMVPNAKWEDEALAYPPFIAADYNTLWPAK